MARAVEPPNVGHIGASHFSFCSYREVLSSSQWLILICLNQWRILNSHTTTSEEQILVALFVCPKVHVQTGLDWTGLDGYGKGMHCILHMDSSSIVTDCLRACSH